MQEEQEEMERLAKQRIMCISKSLLPRPIWSS